MHGVDLRIVEKGGVDGGERRRGEGAGYYSASIYSSQGWQDM